MITVPRDVFRDALAYSVVHKAGGRKVRNPAQVRLSGMPVDGGDTKAEVLEYATADGTVIARLVKACGAVEAWLDASLATDTLIARSDAEAEKERVIKEVKAFAERTRKDREKAPDYVLSTACIHAAIRHNARIGRLYDRNDRGDRTRANLAGALERAAKAGV